MNELQERLQARQETDRAFVTPLPMASPRMTPPREPSTDDLPLRFARRERPIARRASRTDMSVKRAKASARRRIDPEARLNTVLSAIGRIQPCNIRVLCAEASLKPSSLNPCIRLLAARALIVRVGHGDRRLFCLPDFPDLPKLQAIAAAFARNGKPVKRSRPTRAEIFERRAQLAQERLEQVRATVERLAPCTAAEVAEAISEGALGTVKSRLWRLYKAGQVAKVMFGSTAKWGVPGVDYGKLTTRDRMLEYMRAAEGEGWVRIIDVMRALGFSCKSSGSVWGAIYECLAGGIIERNGRKGTAARWRVVRGV